METIQAELTSNMIASTKAHMANGMSYLEAIESSLCDHAAMVERICAGGKRAMARAVTLTSDVRFAVMGDR